MKLNDKKLSPLLWLWLPILWLALEITGEIFLSPETLLSLHKEGSLHEIIQFLMLSFSFVIAVYVLFKMEKRGQVYLITWLILAATACLYVTLEEISYGQSFFQWTTPDHWKEINNQNETNLHNTSRLLNHIPRYLLMFGIAVGGLLIPVIYKTKPSLLPKRLSIIYPPPTLFNTALCLLIIAVSHKLHKELFDEKLFQRASEVEEIFMYFFVFLYILILKRRILT